jgi:hypothetical protein
MATQITCIKREGPNKNYGKPVAREIRLARRVKNVGLNSASLLARRNEDNVPALWASVGHVGLGFSVQLGRGVSVQALPCDPEHSQRNTSQCVSRGIMQLGPSNQILSKMCASPLFICALNT